MRRVILNFHGIGAPERSLEPGEHPYWIEEDFFAACIELSERYKEQVETTFTFDDGNCSDAEIAAPRLYDAGRKGIFFPLASRLDVTGSLMISQIKALINSGHTVGSHGSDHVDWKNLDELGKRREWVDARSIISDAVGANVSLAAIPFGRYNRDVLRGLRKAGYSKIFSSDGGSWHVEDWPIPRTSVRSDTTTGDVEETLLGKENFIQTFRRKSSMFIKARL